MSDIRYVKYTCAKCNAEDTLTLFSNEAVPPAINCWKCHAGFQKPIEEMLQLNFGMFPVRERHSHGARP